MSPERANKPGSPVSETIVRRIAAEKDVDPLDLPPLFETVEPDALDQLVRSLDGGSDSSVRLDYAGYRVVVSGAGDVVVSPRCEGH